MITIENTHDNCYTGEAMLSVHNNYINITRYGTNGAIRVKTHVFTDNPPQGSGPGPFNGMMGSMLNKEELTTLRDYLNMMICSFKDNQ